MHWFGEYGKNNNVFRQSNSITWLQCGKFEVIDTNVNCIKVFNSGIDQSEFSFDCNRTLHGQNLLYPYCIIIVSSKRDESIVIRIICWYITHICVCIM